MTNHFKLLLIVSLLVSCNQKEKNDCSVDTEFKEQFENCIRIIERPTDESIAASLTVNDVLQSIACIEAITQHKNHMKFENDVMFAVYETEAERDSDIKAWRDWYDKNKCGYTMNDAENAFKSVRKKFPDYKSDSVMRSLEKTWMEYKGDSVRIKDSLFRVSMDAYWPTVKVKK